jgi:hypothetical protein
MVHMKDKFLKMALCMLIIISIITFLISCGNSNDGGKTDNNKPDENKQVENGENDDEVDKEEENVVIEGIYEVGPGKTYETISKVPWGDLKAGDTVLIHWREEPYNEKLWLRWQGTEKEPITIKGVPGPDGQLPVLDGKDARDDSFYIYSNGARGVIKVGGVSYDDDILPQHIVIDSLKIINARENYKFRDFNGSGTYVVTASAIYIEKGENITIRNCILTSNSQALSITGGKTRNVLVERNHIYGNGNPGGSLAHNVYVCAKGITFQYNYFGPLADGADGHNIKDRSSGTVIRYNWIEGGTRQLDLVNRQTQFADPETDEILHDPLYKETYVYGNILIKPDDRGNPQVVHYGGDSGSEEYYRDGTLYFYNNTVITYRTGVTTLVRLSNSKQRCDARNNIIYAAGENSSFSILANEGIVDLSHNWISKGWSFGVENMTETTAVKDDGTQIEGTSPGFVSLKDWDFHLDDQSPCIGAGTDLYPSAAENHPVVYQYKKHQDAEPRQKDSFKDIGAFQK